jgi:tetratricopeptide (TPR) repeat protein
MYIRILLTICLFASFLSAAHPDVLKQKISTLESQSQSATGIDKSRLMMELAIAYNEDQNRELAFKTFLEALKFVPQPPVQPKSTTEELTDYNDALKLYLEHHTGQEVISSADKILTTYGLVVEQHPDYYLLNFLVSAAYANLAQYEQFFRTFYRSYEHFPDSFMAYRTQAVLHIKLYERARTSEEREVQAKLIYEKVMLAIKANPQDPSLYKMMISFAPVDQKPQIISSALKKIVSDNIIVPRADIQFYVREAVSARQKESAQLFVNKAREWYQFSKVVNAAQELIDQSKD